MEAAKNEHGAPLYDRCNGGQRSLTPLLRLADTGSCNMSAVTSKCLIFGYSYRWMGGTRDNMDLVWSIPSA